MKGKLDDETFSLMEKYAQNHVYAGDQLFLKDVVWPKAKNDCIIHGFLEVDWMKETRDNNNFVGQGYTEDDKPLYDSEPSGKKIL